MVPRIGLKAPSTGKKRCLSVEPSKDASERKEGYPQKNALVTPPETPNASPPARSRSKSVIEVIEMAQEEKKMKPGELQKRYHMEDRKDLWNEALGVVRITFNKLNYELKEGDTFVSIYEKHPRRFVELLDSSLYRFRQKASFGFLTDDELDQMTTDILKSQLKSKLARMK